MGPSGIQIAVILVIVLLLFGGKKIPELAKGLGNGIRDFKKAISEKDDVATTEKTEDSENKEEIATIEKTDTKQS